jgi:putative acyl-CoA dehydrogenase
MATHEVLNQPPPLEDYDVTAGDPALLDGVTREGAAWSLGALHDLGTMAGSAQAQTWARHANESPPVLRTHDRFGNRIDEVEYHPDYHRLMDVAVRHGLHGAPWSDPRPGAHVARAAGFYAWSQCEMGHTCPISMTYSRPGRQGRGSPSSRRGRTTRRTGRRRRSAAPSRGWR